MKYFQALLSHWSTYAGAVGVVLTFLQPSLNAYVAAHPHATAAILIGAALAAYHMTAPKDQQPPTLKIIAIGLLCLGFAPHAKAQTQLTNIYAAGVSYNNSGSPAVAGTALYARQVSNSGTYAFTVVDALTTNLKPFTVTTNFGGGIAQKLFTLGNVPIFVPTSAGISYNGTSTGWAWSTGALASIKIKGNWRIFPHVRITKSSVSNGTGYQPIVGVMFGWGN